MDLLKKLKEVERFINIYKNKNDPQLIEEIRIDIPLEKLRTIVPPKNDDYLLYMGYMLTKEQVDELNKELGGVLKPDFKIYYYVLEAVGHYDW